MTKNNKKSLNDIINEAVKSAAIDNRGDVSMRNEDLSIIDDEMPIKNTINKNLKPEYVQGLIDKI